MHVNSAFTCSLWICLVAWSHWKSTHSSRTCQRLSPNRYSPNYAHLINKALHHQLGSLVTPKEYIHTTWAGVYSGYSSFPPSPKTCIEGVDRPSKQCSNFICYYVRNTTLWGMVFEENNQGRCGVTRPDATWSSCYHGFQYHHSFVTCEQRLMWKMSFQTFAIFLKFFFFFFII